MKKQLFRELLESIREAGEIRRGERAPARKFVFEPDDVRSIREKGTPRATRTITNIAGRRLEGS
jgi:hypothetical protein